MASLSDNMCPERHFTGSRRTTFYEHVDAQFRRLQREKEVALDVH